MSGHRIENAPLSEYQMFHHPWEPNYQFLRCHRVAAK